MGNSEIPATVVELRKEILNVSTSVYGALGSFADVAHKVEKTTQHLATYEKELEARELKLNAREKALDEKEKKMRVELTALEKMIEEKRALIKKIDEVKAHREEIDKVDRFTASLPSVIDVNVGGQSFPVNKVVLLQSKGSYFEIMLTKHSHQVIDGKLFIDRDPKHFASMIHYILTGEINKESDPHELALEFEFYQIPVPLPLQYSEQFSEWLPNAQFSLLYKASRDGFAGDKFHQKCDNKGPTITIIKSKNGHLFGGYNSLTWDSSHLFKPDDNAFLFTLTNPHNISPTKYYIKPREKYAIGCFPGCGAIFGRDIQIADAPNQNNKSITKFPLSFMDTTGKGDKTFTGEKHFSVEDIEVYSVRTVITFEALKYSC